MSSPDPIQQVFLAAKREFESELPQNTPFGDAFEMQSIKQVFEAADKLQRDQGEKSGLRHLSRIEPFLNRLRNYAKTIEVFVQAKPEILALIWGPIKLLLLWTSEWREGFDAIIRTIERIGEFFPKFDRLLPHFIEKKHVKDVLGLFYRDILDFYLELLKFFGQRNCRKIFEMVWSRRKERLGVIEANMERHARLLGENITFEHIRRENEDRINMFEKFLEIDKHRVTQKFQALETAICPRMYDDKLEWLRKRTCPGTAKWLSRDLSFHQWLDVSSQSTTLLWLKGIPGAGKTFLASWVIATAKKKGRVLFAFPSHAHADITAVSIIHTLLFQLAARDVDLQSILTESNKRDLKSNLAAAQELLITALKCANGVFMVLDGLDEVEPLERKLFLTTLMKILHDCSDVALKVCVSSRAEDDITKILAPKATTLRVDRRNTLEIQVYVKRRFEEWMENSDFLPAGKSEIEALLSPISTKAKGMFLYARIVIDNVVDLTNINDIRRELRALPEDLDDAYKRVVSQIKRLSRRNRAVAKRIMGWIGCSPYPIRLNELEQAVLVGSEAHVDAPTVDSSLNIVKLCGPIVEVVGQTPQFVHFTVKEYVFDKRSNFLDRSQCTLDMLTTCLTYLCYDAMRGDLDEDQLKDNLLSGKYRLQVFASSSWFTLVTQYLRSAQDEGRHEVMNGLMENLFSEMANSSFQNDAAASSGAKEREETADPLRLLWPGAPEFLADTIRFQDDPGKDGWTSSNAETWVNLDPLTISSSCARTEALYERVLRQDINSLKTNNSQREKLQRHYGMDLFKCHYYACPFRRHGFVEYKECDFHMKKHSRPWKCPVKACDFSVIGYSSPDGLERHRLRVHRVVRDETFTQPSCLEDEALYPLLYELVNSGDLDELKSIWPACQQKVNLFTKVELLTVAAGQGSLPMVKLFLEGNDELEEAERKNGALRPVIQNAIQSGNLELTRWILQTDASWRGHYRKQRYRDVVVSVLKSDSAEVFDIWQNIVLHMPHSYVFCEEIFEKTVLNTAKKFPKQEARMLRLWRRLARDNVVEKSTLGRALAMVAQTTYSIEQARVLLKMGAPIDYPRSQINRGYTPLQWACNAPSKEAAHFIKYLLVKGADPKHVRLKKRQGVRNIETWLGMSWSELVNWAAEEQKREQQTSNHRNTERDDEK